PKQWTGRCGRALLATGRTRIRFKLQVDAPRPDSHRSTREVRMCTLQDRLLTSDGVFR
ncbi:unnamed protein product, partial [Cochlearia groenlandica]